jgi:hypothetical protein
VSEVSDVDDDEAKNADEREEKDFERFKANNVQSSQSSPARPRPRNSTESLPSSKQSNIPYSLLPAPLLPLAPKLLTVYPSSSSSSSHSHSSPSLRSIPFSSSLHSSVRASASRSSSSSSPSTLSPSKLPIVPPPFGPSNTSNGPGRARRRISNARNKRNTVAACVDMRECRLRWAVRMRFHFCVCLRELGRVWGLFASVLRTRVHVQLHLHPQSRFFFCISYVL